MTDTSLEAQSTALARSALRQLNRAAQGRPATDPSRKLTIHDVAPGRQSVAVSRVPQLIAGGQGAVARAIARQCGITLEQLHNNAHAAPGPSTETLAAFEKSLSTAAPNQVAAARAVEQHTASICCRLDNLRAMCSDLNGSLPAAEQCSVQALILKLVASCLQLHPALDVARLRGEVQPAGASSLAIAILDDGHWRTPILREVARRGVASIAQWIDAWQHDELTRSQGHVLADDDTGENDFNGLLSVFDLRSHADQAARINAEDRHALSLFIVPAPAGAMPSGAGTEAEELNVTLTLHVDARLADSRACGEFLNDLAALFAEPLRALL